MAGPSSKNKSSRGPTPSPSPPVAAKLGGLVTFLIKLGGLAVAGNEALLTNPPRDPLVFAIAAFMMAGAQGIDTLIDSFLGRKNQ